MENFKARLDIVAVIQYFLPLHKEGVNFSACCPFHSEKTPSFKVSPQKQIYHCFGCGANGDVIKFVEEYKKCDFKEATTFLADTFGVESPLKQNKEVSRYKILSEKLNKIAGIYTQNLLSNVQIMDYITKRGFSQEDITRFSFGYCKGGEWRGILSESEAKELGFITPNNYEFFKDRFMIALFDRNYKNIGFVGRTHPYKNFAKSPKYINSKDSLLYKKSFNLYNLSRAKNSIIKEKKALVVEGYLDACAAWKMGIKNCVATGGTAFNKGFLSALLPLDCEITFLFDSDLSGQKAILRAIEVCQNAQIFNVFKGNLKNDCKDLGEVLEKCQSPEITKTDGFSYFLVYHLKTAKNAKEKDNVINQWREKIASMNNYFLCAELISKIFKVSGIDLSKTHQMRSIESFLASDLQNEVFKAILNDKNFAFVAFDFLYGEELGQWENSFKELMYKDTKDNASIGLSIDSSVKDLDFKQAQRAMFCLIFQNYQQKIAQAKAKNDLNLAFSLSEKYNSLKEQTRVFFTT